jgi:hypothetical protein
MRGAAIMIDDANLNTGTPATREWVKEWVEQRLEQTERRFDERFDRLENRFDQRFDELQSLVRMIAESQITLIAVVGQIDQRVTALETFHRNGNGQQPPE